MDLHGPKPEKAPKPAWARTGALALFLLTGVLLLTSLSTARSHSVAHLAPSGIVQTLHN
jgi:hypothetical protein